jgi:hypothetical protein
MPLPTLQPPLRAGPAQVPQAAPQPPQAPRAIDITPPASGSQWRVPRTPAERAIIQSQRDVISSQVENVRSRRSEIASAYERSSGANRAGLDQQLRVLDDRILRLEQDLAESGRVLYQSDVTSTSTSPPPGMPRQFYNLTSGQVTALSVVFILFVLGPLAGSFGRMVWRKSAKPAMPPGWQDASQRLERLEQAVDTIAVEMERVSEGQRFMTKLMTQNGGPVAASNGGAASAPVNGAQPLPALGAGSPPDPVVLQQQRDEVRVRRS